MIHTIEHREKIQSLKQLLLGGRIEHEQPPEHESMDADIQWGASLFFAKALNLSERFSGCSTLEDYQIFKSNYEKRCKCKVDDTKLFGGFWLRNVLGFVEISSSISSAIFSFDKIVNFKTELTFLFEYYSALGENSKIEKKHFEDAVLSFQKKNNVILDKDGFKNFGFREKDGFYQLSDMDTYFRPYLDNWEDVKFLSAFQEYKWSFKEFSIDRKALEALHRSHHKFYPKTPKISQFSKEKIIWREGKIYKLNFYQNETKYWSGLGNKITGQYWEILVDETNTTQITDEEKVQFFLAQTSYWHGYADPLKFATTKSKKRFLNAALSLILQENDIVGIDHEFEKVWVDGGRHSNIRSLSDINNGRPEPPLDTSDHFELMKSLKEWNSRNHSEALHEQDVRSKLANLIWVIVRHDLESEPIDEADGGRSGHVQFKRINALLESSLERPFILWRITEHIGYKRRDCIPYLLLREEYVTLAFQIIDGLNFSHQRSIESKNEIWEKCIELALITVRSVSNQPVLAAKLVFQIFRQLNRKKYEIPFNKSYRAEDIRVQNLIDSREQYVLKTFEDSKSHNHRMTGGEPKYLMPTIFNELAGLFIKHEEKPMYDNGTVQFPLLKWDGMVWLMKCSTHWKFKQQFDENPPELLALTNAFLASYLKYLDMTEVKQYNYVENKYEVATPLWSEKIERLELIQWVFPIYQLHQVGKLGNFLSPSIDITRTNDQYHKANGFATDKLRTHFGVLLRVLEQLVFPKIPYGFERKKLKEIKLMVEQRIIDYVRYYIKDAPEQARVDLFDHQKEWAFHSTAKEALLPQLAKALNFFKKKDEIIKAILETRSINKILMVAELITSEGVRNMLFEKIKESDLKEYLSKADGMGERSHTLQRIRNYRQLQPQIEQVVAYWEEKMLKGNREHVNELFQTRMLLAYYTKNRDELESIELPKKSGAISPSEFSLESYKACYLALLLLEKDPVNSYTIFNRLLQQHPKLSVLAMNRMAAKMSLAEQIDDLNIYKEALEEWNQFIANNDQVNETNLGAIFIANKLGVFLKLNEYKLMDEMFEKLSRTYRMKPNILEVMIERLIDGNEISSAAVLLSEAQKYHQFGEVREIQFIKDLKAKINEVDNIDDLIVQYSRIFENTAVNLIRVLPPKVNPAKEIGEFMARELALASSKMLDKVKVLTEIEDQKTANKENRYNELVSLALESRLSFLGWTFKRENPKAFSAEGKDQGQIDLDINDFNGKSISTCEAFRFTSKEAVRKHLNKLIRDYSHSRRVLLVLVYSIVEKEGFDRDWKKYSTKTLPTISIPKGYEMKANGLLDLTANFGYDQTGIRIGKATSNNGTIIYHVFVNIRYRID